MPGMGGTGLLRFSEMRLASRSNELPRGTASYSEHAELKRRQSAATAPATIRRERTLLIEG
jgi:hypothetical protein